MATISSKAIVDELIDADGWDSGFQFLAVYEYKSGFGETLYSLCATPNDIHTLIHSPNVRSARLLWKREGAVVPEGVVSDRCPTSPGENPL